MVAERATVTTDQRVFDMPVDVVVPTPQRDVAADRVRSWRAPWWHEVVGVQCVQSTIWPLSQVSQSQLALSRVSHSHVSHTPRLKNAFMLLEVPGQRGLRHIIEILLRHDRITPPGLQCDKEVFLCLFFGCA